MSNNESSKHVKFEVAKEILAKFIAMSCEDGFNPEDPATKQFLEDKQRLNEYDEEVIDKILNVYAGYLTQGDNNE